MLLLVAPLGQTLESATPPRANTGFVFITPIPTSDLISFTGAAKITCRTRWPNSTTFYAIIVPERCVSSIPTCSICSTT